MLQSIRDRAQGWLSWIIIGLIVVPFALWGVQEYATDDVDINVASIGDTNITQQEFLQAYEQQRQRMRSLLGDDSSSLNEEKIKQDVIDSLVTNEVLRQSTDQLGLQISNTQLARQIQSMQEFQQNGQFSKAIFLEQLRGVGLTPEGFEGRVRDGLLTEQLNAGVTSMAVVTQHELDEAIRLKNQQREIGYLILPWENFKKDVTVTEGEIKQYYDEHRNSLVNPEQVSIEYIELSVDDLAKNIKSDEQELQKLYDEQRANFAVEEQRRASQILIKPANAADDAALAAASSKANNLLKRLQAGEDFGKLAKEYSQDTATATTGGDLGFISKGGALDPAIEQAIYSLKPGELSEPIETSTGFHIFKLTEIKPAHTKPFEEVRTDLDKEYRQITAQEQFFEKSEPLTNLVFENPDTLGIAAKELNLQIKTTDLFSRNGGTDNITSQAKVISAAFSDEVLSQGFNSEPVEIGENHLVVLRVKEHNKSSVRSLEQERQSITEKLRKAGAQNKAREVGKLIEKRLAEGADPEVIAKEYQTDWVKPGFVGREDASVKNPAIVNAAFALSKANKLASAKSSPVFGGKSLDSGDYAVIAVYSIKEGTPTAMDASARLALRRELQRIRAESEYQNFVNELKEETEIVVHKDKL